MTDREAAGPKRTLWPLGSVAGSLALSFAWAASRINAAIPFPPLSLAERVIRITPGGIATFFIEKLGHNAVRLLSVGSTLGFLAVSAILPRLSSRNARPHPYVSGGLLAGISAAALSDPVRPSVTSALALSLGMGALYALVLAWLLEPPRTVESRPADPSRRRVLAGLGAVAAATAVGGTVLGHIARRLVGPDTNVAIRSPDEPAPIPSRAAFPSVVGLSEEVTPAEKHYVVDIDLLDPVVEAAGWTLTVGGLVERPSKLTFSELQGRFRLFEEVAVLTCISNWVGGPLVGSSRWTGIRLRDVLSSAGLRKGAVEVMFRCADGYTESLPLERAMDSSVLLAIAQDGRPLRQEHGFPCRLRAPAVYGMKNPKWLPEIEVVSQDHQGYWEQRGWSEDATVRTESRIDTAGSDLRAGSQTWVAGVAWAGIRGISKVEVSTDSGRMWGPAILLPPLSPYAWTQWAFRWTPPRPGTYRVLCRATDGTEALQDAARRLPHPSGASGYHEVGVSVA